jgi:signal transduction histidine kinase
MKTVRRSIWGGIGGLAAVLASALVFLYGKSLAHPPESYFESLALLHQIRQLDTQWELEVLKAKTGVSQHYDPLVDPLKELNQQWAKLETLETARERNDTATWARHRDAYLQAVAEKTRLIEHFKSHNAVLRNSLAFLPTAEDDIQVALGNLVAGHQHEAMDISVEVYDTVLTTLEYVQSTSADKAAEVEANLGRLEADRTGLSSDKQAAVDILIAHVRTVLREQPVVSGLLVKIAEVPVAACLDSIIGILSEEQLQASQRVQRTQHYLLAIAVVLASLLLYLLSRLIHSYAVIHRVNKALQAANEGLEQRVDERTRDLKQAQGELINAARHAGMAEIATNVLHNVGNVLNSVNVSADVISRKVRGSKTQGLAKAVDLMHEHANDLGRFMTQDEKGKLLPSYLSQLVEALAHERHGITEELEQLTKSVEHIKDIVATQQSYAGTFNLILPLRVDEVIDDALRMHTSALTRHHVTVVKDYGELPELLLDKHRLLLILVNLISNAKNAMSGGSDDERQLTLSANVLDSGTLRISVKDQGEGISQENLTRIFSHGFTTRKDGHGFGLHSCVVAAMEMDGSLSAHSDGLGRGAVFTLELPAIRNGGRP